MINLIDKIDKNKNLFLINSQMKNLKINLMKKCLKTLKIKTLNKKQLQKITKKFFHKFK